MISNHFSQTKAIMILRRKGVLKVQENHTTLREGSGYPIRAIGEPIDSYLFSLFKLA